MADGVFYAELNEESMSLMQEMVVNEESGVM